MKRGKVISILRFFSTIDKEIQMNNATVEDLNDRYYSTLGAVNMDGLPHGKGGVSKPVENMVANVPYVSTLPRAVIQPSRNLFPRCAV